MRPMFKAGLITLVAAAVLAVPVSAATAGTAKKLDVTGLRDGTTLVTFSTDKTKIDNSRTVTGLVGDASLVGIDYRVQDGLLYGVGNAGGLYSIDGAAVATKVGQLTVALSGTFFAVDFNPAANALRILSDTGQNLRQPFAALPTLAATVADTPLVIGTTTATGVTGAAYTNNDVDPTTATTLFDIGTATDQVLVQSPANSGMLVATGALGVAAGPNAGFDIYSTLSNGKTVSNQAFATLEVGGAYGLYAIDLLTGAADRVGDLDGVTDIAIALDQQ